MILETIILGIVEGITEFLPISSTAHLILTAHVLDLPQTNFQKSFGIIIQLGAILSVVVLYWRSFLSAEVLKRIVVAFIPTGIIGLLLYRIVKTYLLGEVHVVLWTLFMGGIFLLVFEYLYKENSADSSIEKISYKQCLLLGCFQAIAIVPGVSRSAATIVGGLSLGIPRKTIVEFSFLLAVPTMLAASSLDIAKNYQEFIGLNALLLVVGFVVSFVVALISIKWLLAYVARHDFKIFGWYRIIVAVLFFLFLKK